MIVTYFRANSNYIVGYLLEESYTYKYLLSKEVTTYCLACFDVYREQRSSILVLLTGNDVPPSFVFLKENGVPWAKIAREWRPPRKSSLVSLNTFT